MFFLKDNLEPGTFTPAYCDTDSMGIATCRTDSEGLKAQTAEEKLRAVFDPIVRPEMRDNWEANWKKWFVTEDTVEDEKYPGKLKCKYMLGIKTKIKLNNSGEFAFERGMFVALCPKTYCAYDADYEEKQSEAYKLGRKGIPHR